MPGEDQKPTPREFEDIFTAYRISGPGEKSKKSGEKPPLFKKFRIGLAAIALALPLLTGCTPSQSQAGKTEVVSASLKETPAERFGKLATPALEESIRQAKGRPTSNEADIYYNPESMPPIMAVPFEFSDQKGAVQKGVMIAQEEVDGKGVFVRPTFASTKVNEYDESGQNMKSMTVFFTDQAGKQLSVKYDFVKPIPFNATSDVMLASSTKITTTDFEGRTGTDERKPPTSQPNQSLDNIMVSNRIGARYATPTAAPSPTSVPRPTEPRPTAVATVASTAAPTATGVPPTATVAPTAVPPTATVTREATATSVPLEQLPVTQKALAELASKIGINITPEQLLKQGIRVEEKKGIDGKNYKIAWVGDYPIMVQTEKGWEKDVVTELLNKEEIDFGFVYDVHTNQYRAKERIFLPAGVNDRTISENSKVSGVSEAFYWSKLFWSEDSSKQDWRWVDEYLSFLQNNGLKDGSPKLIDRLDSYYNQWLIDLANKSPKNETTKALFTEILTSRIKLLVNHCKGQVKSWTINEIFGKGGVWENSVWQRTIGSDYVALAIQAAREADPNTQIVLNDYFLENDTEKNTAMYNLAQDLISKGILKEGDVIGIQGHQGIAFPGTKEQIKTSLKRFIDLGLKVRITELDVFDVFTNDVQTQKNKAAAYFKYIQAARELNTEYRLKGRKDTVVDTIIVWGTNHGSSWQREDKKYKTALIYPLLFDDLGSPELSYFLLAAMIASSK